MADTTPKGLAKQLLSIIENDRDRLLFIDRYYNGEHDDPYMPDYADAEYRLLAGRARSNWMPLLVSTPAQALYVDSFRPGSDGAPVAVGPGLTPSMKHWQRSRMDARQHAVMRGAFKFGHSFVLTELNAKGQAVSKGLSALRTAALYEDPANDDDPYAVLTITTWPSEGVKGKARMWDGKREYAVAFKAINDLDSVTASSGKLHRASRCPVTRFAAYVDLEGRTVGLVEPMIPLQDRINQTIFDLLVAQTYGSFKVRWVTGMAPPLLMEPVYADPDDPNSEIVDWKPQLDSQGNPRPAPINHSAKRMLFSENDEAKFGTLDETPLGGYIESIDMSIRHLSAIAQVPPHHLLGQIANLSAEALQAAETSLLRMVEEFQSNFGESWERVFRVAAELEGDLATAEDFTAEVIWRDMEQKSMAQSADALGKLADQLGIPKEGLWQRVPNVTSQELGEWKDLKAKEPDVALADAVTRSTSAIPASDDEAA